MGDFHQLVAWQEANALAQDLRAALSVRGRRLYPGLRSQILRSAGSVPDNLAEGCAKRSRLELARYAEMAYASSKEVQSQLVRAHSSRSITAEQFANLAPRADRVSRLCYGLTRR